MGYVKNVLVCLLVLFSCKHSEDKLVSGAIRKPGVYNFDDNFVVEVVVANALVNYTVKDFNGKVKIAAVHSFSDYHSWAFYLEDNGTFWVISSDIGYSFFKLENGRYVYRELPRKFDVNQIPSALLQELPEFFD